MGGPASATHKRATLVMAREGARVWIVRLWRSAGRYAAAIEAGSACAIVTIWERIKFP